MGTLTVETKTPSWYQKGSPITTSGQQHIIGEKSPVILYTCINHHAGTPKLQSKEHSKSRCTIQFDLRVPDYSSMYGLRGG